MRAKIDDQCVGNMTFRIQLAACNIWTKPLIVDHECDCSAMGLAGTTADHRSIFGKDPRIGQPFCSQPRGPPMRESREPVQASRQISTPCYLVCGIGMSRLQRLQHASYPPRSLPPWWCAQDQTMRRPGTHRHHAHLPAYSGVPSPGKETSPHGGKLRGGGTRGAGGVLVMNIARPGQARSWRTCRRRKTAKRRDVRTGSDRRRDRASASHPHRDSPTATKTNRSPLTLSSGAPVLTASPAATGYEVPYFFFSFAMPFSSSIHSSLNPHFSHRYLVTLTPLKTVRPAGT